MAEKHLKKCSTSLVLREMLIKKILRFHLTVIRMAKVKLKGQHMLVRLWSKGNTPPLLLGVQPCSITLEINLVVSQKIGNSSTSRHRYTTPWHIPKICSTIPQRIIHNSQELETT
ncbi:rCG53348 [Rattus norvegicus]|uniref:RCG53348 n=1 Tax=Rattus norvegicus TaxID=10116 RepID=A6JMV5_RAT|nr:rCG53348 [Rattus norvegicus]